MTLKKAEEIALGEELAAKHVVDIQSETTPSSVNQVDADQEKNGTKDTKDRRPDSEYRCGEKHEASACRFKDAQCVKCVMKARPVPLALKVKVEKELNRLQSEGIISPVEFTEWAAPIVPVVKQDGSVRICGDYKCTVNQVSKLDNYPIPKTEDMLATLGGGNTSTKLDMSQAYQQLLLDEESKKFTTINTHKGLYQYNRLPFGVSSAPGIFQRTMENLLQGIPHVVVQVDDILVSGKGDPDHLANLEAVLSRLSTAGLKLRLAKCLFVQPEVTYCGYVISGDGIQPVAAKVDAIKNAP